jgi:hypothetical protein
MDELIRLLERECVLLEHVAYRTSVSLLLLRAGEDRFLPQAADDIHDAIDQLNELELSRAAMVSRLALELGVSDELFTLPRLVATAPAAIAGRLQDVEERLRAALSQLQELVGASTAVAAAGLDSVRRSLGRWSGAAAGGGYGVAVPPAPSRFDGSF